jgi:hypothetical protein
VSKLGWNEIRQNATKFSREWKDASREDAEAQTFWNEFFEVFGVRRRTVASFEEPVKTLKDTYGAIDLFWPGRLLAEHKSRGKSLEKATTQAITYIHDLQREGRDEEIPRYIIVSDFARIVLHDLEPDEPDDAVIEISLDDLYRNVRHFAFILGQQTHRFREEDPANIEAAELMAELHDAMAEGGYPAHDLERLLVRILFCLFADDTGIFEPKQFELFIENYAKKKDGSDLGQQLSALFEILNTPTDERQRGLDEDLKAFPYVNGDLFAGHLPLAGFNRSMRDKLVAATRFNWSKISPAIFGSLFQGIMDDKERRQIGAHYTSERDILKVIRPLFLDELQAEFEQIKNDRSARRDKRLADFQEKLSKFHFLDPACGCGNFLVISYRELRRLELQSLTLRHETKLGTKELDLGEVAKLSKVDVNQFYGIEIGEWAARIAETALWLTDHQMNIELSLAFGNIFQRIPLRAAPHIRCANALRFDWNELLPAKECSYVLGNPPFVGHQWRTDEQQDDMRRVWGDDGRFRRLDYVTCWYRKASEYVQEARSAIKCAFVSTNSISQGEQVSTLWDYLFSQGIQICFAHRTFPWESEARGRAHVHVVVIGFARDCGGSQRLLFDYPPGSTEPHVSVATNINPYLIDASNVLLPSRTRPSEGYPEMKKGSQPTDGGFLLLTAAEKDEALKAYPEIQKWLRPYVGGEELINGNYRWCLWLKDADPAEVRKSPEVQRRLEGVRTSRLNSPTASVRDFAERPAMFTQDRQPDQPYLAVPEVSSENRHYVPIGYLPETVIASNKLQIIVGGTRWHFGVLTSEMHMAWVRAISGRLKSDISYSPSVYNNFPWPVDATASQKKKVEECGQAVLDARQPHLERGATLADLYDPLTMPGDLLDAHHALDRAVDKCYRAGKFGSERERVEFLFRLYETLTSPLAPVEAVKKRRGRKGKVKGD